MFKTDVYIHTLIELLKVSYKERLLYVGLQGSYLRGEATDHSDIDIMVVISDINRVQKRMAANIRVPVKHKTEYKYLLISYFRKTTALWPIDRRFRGCDFPT